MLATLRPLDQLHEEFSQSLVKEELFQLDTTSALESRVSPLCRHQREQGQQGQHLHRVRAQVHVTDRMIAAIEAAGADVELFVDAYYDTPEYDLLNSDCWLADRSSIPVPDEPEGGTGRLRFRPL